MEQRNSDLRTDLRNWRDPAAGQFLSDMQALRAQAGLDQGELAARAHYPRDVIAAAESALPELPVLAAYVRGCGGTGDDMVDWEDRWRSVTGAATSPVLSARVAGLSGAAEAGARLSEVSSVASPEEQDPTVVLSALHRFAERMAQPTGSGAGSHSPDGTGTATEGAGAVRASGTSVASEESKAPGASEASGASVAGVDGVAARDGAGTGAAQTGAGTGAIISGSGGSAGRERPVPLQHVPQEESGEPGGQRDPGDQRGLGDQRGPGGQRGGTAGRTLAVVVVAAALLCLLIVLLAF